MPRRASSKIEYTNLSLPKKFVEEIERTIQEHPEFGYTSFAEFAKEAIREKITKLKG